MSKLVFRKYAALAVMVCCSAPVLGAESARPDPSRILAESRNVRITGQDLETELLRVPAQHRAEVLASRARIAKLLESILINKTLAAEARSAGIDHEPEMNRQIQSAADKLLAQEQTNRAMKAVTVPDFTQRARELYQLDSEKYTLPPTVHASHILVKTKSRSPEEALKLIKDVREQAVAGKKKFEDLAVEYSEDPSAKTNKGDLGFFDAGRMVKPFADAAFAMTTPGEISEPVKTNYGYHIIQFHEKKAKVVRSFDEVKDKIIQGERDKFLSEFRQKYYSNILLDPSLKLNEEAVDRYLTTAEAPADGHKPSEPTKPGTTVKQ